MNKRKRRRQKCAGKIVDPKKIHEVNEKAQGMLKHLSTFMVGIDYRQCLKDLELWEEDWE